jgi:hypothetical protein
MPVNYKLMFEKLLEKILSRILGQYVDGISKDQMNVGIWSGNVDISNLRLKQQIIQELNLPFQLKFGMIDNLKMKIPWKNLSTASIQVRIQGIYLLIVPMASSSWAQLEHNFIQNKETFLMNYAKAMIDTMTEKLRMQGKEADKGYFGKLVEKIVDNLSISVKDIHVRLECVAEPIAGLSFGLTLDSLNIQTCDSSWKTTFVDIDSQSSDNKLLFKSLEINSFYIYWNTEESNFLSASCQQPSEYFTRLQALIFNDANSPSQEVQQLRYLFNFSTVAKLKKSQLTQDLIAKGTPEWDIEIQLDACNFSLSQDQIRQSSRIATVVHDFSRFLGEKEKIVKAYKWRPNKFIESCTNPKSRSKCVREWWKYLYRSVRFSIRESSAKFKWWYILPKTRSEKKQEFLGLFQKAMFVKEGEAVAVLTRDERLLWENLIGTFDQKQLQNWVDHNLKTQKIQEELQKEQSKKTGFLGLWGKSKEVTEEEEVKIEELVDSIMQQSDSSVSVPDDFGRYKVRFIQRRFNVSLTKKDVLESGKEEVFLQTKDMTIDLHLRKNGVRVSSELASIKLSYKRKNFVDKLEYDEKLFFCDKMGDRFFQVSYEEKPSEHPGLDKKVQLRLGAVTAIYNPKMVRALVDIFSVEASEEVTEELRARAKKKFREAKDIGENAMKEFLNDQPKMLLDIQMKTPQIILPIRDTQLMNSACWIFYPGDLKIVGDTFSGNDKQEMFDNFTLALTDIQFVHCQKVNMALSRSVSIEKVKSQEVEDFFYIFSDFNIDVKIRVLKRIFVDLNLREPKVAVKAQLNALKMTLTPQLIAELKDIQKIFTVEERLMAAKEKAVILTKAERANYLTVSCDNVTTLYFAAFYQNAIHLFDNPRDQARARLVIDLEDRPGVQFVNSENVVKVAVVAKEYRIAFDSEEMFRGWTRVIEEAMDKVKARVEDNSFVLKEDTTLRESRLDSTLRDHSGHDPKDEMTTLALDFLFENLEVKIESKDSFYLLDTERLALVLTQTESVLNCSVELKKFSLLNSKANKEETYILTSFYDKSLASQILKGSYVQKQEQLLIVRFEQKTLPDLTDSKTVTVLFGSLFVDFEPSLISTLMRTLVSPGDAKEGSGEADQLLEAIKIDVQDKFAFGQKVLGPYQNGPNKMNSPEEAAVSLSLKLEMQAINVLLINGIKANPIMNVICQDSSLELVMREGAMQVKAEFFELKASDLTNFPHTLGYRNVATINPRKVFGKYNDSVQVPLMSLEFWSVEPERFNVGSDLVNSHLSVKIDNIEVVGLLPPVMRVIGFLTDQLLPSLSGQFDLEKKALVTRLITTNLNEKSGAVGASREGHGHKTEDQLRAESYALKRKAFIAIHKPFWMRMHVSITNTKCTLPINSRSRVVAYIEQLTVINHRFKNASRICRRPSQFKESKAVLVESDGTRQALEGSRPSTTGYELDGVWNDDYDVVIHNMGLSLCQEGKADQKLTSAMNLSVKAQLPLFEQEYLLVHDPVRISNYQNRHLDTLVMDNSPSHIRPDQVIYDNAMIVHTHLTAFILRIGNFEYLSLMKCLETCVQHNDGLDEVFVMNYEQKEQERKPGAMVVFTMIDKIAMVSLDNLNDNAVSTKIFLNDFRFTMVSHPTGESAISLKIQDLRGYHLLKCGDQYHEKGFIGELWVTKVHEPRSTEELAHMFLEDIDGEGLLDKGSLPANDNPLNIELTMESTTTNSSIQIKLSRLVVLLQTDVLLELLSIIEHKDLESPGFHRQSTQLSPASKKPPKKSLPMSVFVELSQNSFLLPSSNSEIILVLRSDICLVYKSFPLEEHRVAMAEELFKSTLEGLSSRNIDLKASSVQEQGDPRVSQLTSQGHKEKTSLILNMNDCEMFIIDFVDFFREEKHPASKREIVLPFNTGLMFFQFNLVKASSDPDRKQEEVNVNKLSMTIDKQVEVKITVLDVELLLGIMNYQLFMASKRQTPANAPVDPAQDDSAKQPVAASDSQVFTYAAIDVDEFKLTIINDNSNIFAPVMIFKLKKFELFVIVEATIKCAVNFGFEAFYFNSQIFYWEPFVETIRLNIGYSTHKNESGVVGKFITVRNEEQLCKLNVNVSIALLNKIKFILETWEVMKGKNEEEAQKVKGMRLENYLKSIQAQVIRDFLARERESKASGTTSYISPIRITNTIGYPIVVRYYKKTINVTNGKPVLKSMNEKFIELADGESKPFSTDEAIEDYDDVHDKLRSSISYKFVSVQIQHPDFTISKIDNINVVINHSKKINLKGKEKNLGDYKVIYSSRTNFDIKEILIGSSILVVNMLAAEMRIEVNHPFGKKEFKLGHKKELYIPFDMVSYLFDIFVDGKRMVFKGKFDSFYLKQTGHFMVLSSEDKSTHFVLKVYQEVKFRYIAKLVAIPALSFTNNLPMPISVTLLNSLKHSKTVSLAKSEKVSFCDFDLSTCLKMSVSVPGFNPSELYTLVEMDKDKKEFRYNYPKMIGLNDIEGLSTKINLARTRDGYSHFCYSIFCNVVIVNETPFKIVCNASEKFKMKKEKVGGQHPVLNHKHYDDKIVLVGGLRTFINLSLASDDALQSSQFSNTITTQGLTSGIFNLPVRHPQKPNTDLFLELGYSMQLLSMDKSKMTTSKVIQVTPKIVLYNASKVEVLVDSEDPELKVLRPDEKRPLYIFSKKNDKCIGFSVLHEEQLCRVNCPLDLNKVGTATFTLTNDSKTATRIFKVEIIFQTDYLFATFTDRTGCDDFHVLNLTQFDLLVFQTNFRKEHSITIPPDVSREFSLINPYQMKSVDIVLVSKESQSEVEVFTVKLNKLAKDIVQFKGNKGMAVVVNLQLKNDTRQLVVKTVDPRVEKRPKKTRKRAEEQAPQYSIVTTVQSDYTNLDLSIQELGVSVIAKYLNQNSEMFYLHFSGIKVIAILAEDQQEFQLAVQYFNVDSNYSSKCKYPVLLTLSKLQEFLGDSKFFNFHTIINKAKSPNLYNFDLFELEVHPITLTAEFSLVNAILAFKKQMDKIFVGQDQKVYLNKYFEGPPAQDQPSSPDPRLDKLEWEIIHFKTSNQWIYCKVFKLSLLKVMMTFNMSAYSTSDTKDGSDESNMSLLIETFGVTFLNIDESPLSFSGLKLDSVFESVDVFTNTIVNHLKDQKNLNIAKLVGSLDIIGNPVSLFSNLSSGVVEFFEKPVSGFVQGPVEGFYGIAQGSSSLVKNTAAGTFNTLAKFTSSLATGLTALSMDKEFKAQRNQNRAQKPKNMLDGMGKGFVSFGKGMLSGITGVVSQPVKEVKNSGATGIFYGVLKGFSGLVTKPLGGFMDAASQTAEGIKKSVTNSEDQANEMKIRVPRVFYSSLHYFKIYNPDDSSTMKSLKTIEKGKYENDTFFDAIEVTVVENKRKTFIVLTNQNFLILGHDKTVLLFKIEIRDISRMRYVDESHMAIEYYLDGEKDVINLTNSKENIFKIINTVNYCKYINHVDGI